MPGHATIPAVLLRRGDRFACRRGATSRFLRLGAMELRTYRPPTQISSGQKERVLAERDIALLMIAAP